MYGVSNLVERQTHYNYIRKNPTDIVPKTKTTVVVKLRLAA
jgi:hypothetical protein